MIDARPIGFALPDWKEPPVPPSDLVLEGRAVVLEPLRAEAHSALLFKEIEGEDWLWDYMPVGPFHSAAQFHRFMAQSEQSSDPFFLAIRMKEDKRVVGFASFLRITPASGSIEVGFIMMSPSLQKTPEATEAMYLMMKWAFDAGYRRYEWKCDALNKPSRRAAQRYGFSYEGVFRQATVYKGRNRDTAWFAVIDKDWPALREAFEMWLSPGNFSESGRQREKLGDLTRLVRVSSDPGL